MIFSVFVGLMKTKYFEWFFFVLILCVCCNQGMREKYKKILTSKRPELVEEMDPESGLMNHLESKKVLTRRQAVAICVSFVMCFLLHCEKRLLFISAKASLE